MASNQQPDPNATPLQRFLNPGVEGGLGALLQILGTYEAARGVPSGAPLEVLGGLAYQNAANRQALIQGNTDVMEREAALAGQGLLPSGPNMSDQDKAFYQEVGHMTPQAAERTIEERAGAAAELKKPHASHLVLNKDTGRYNWVDPFTREVSDAGDALAQRPKPDDDMIKGSKRQQDLRALLQQHPEFKNDLKGALAQVDAMEQNEDVQKAARIDWMRWQDKQKNITEYTDKQARAKLAVMMDGPPQKVYGAGTVYVNAETGEKGNPRTANEVASGKFVPMSDATYKTVFFGTQRVQRAALNLLNDGIKVLPAAKANIYKNMLAQVANRWKLPIEAYGGVVAPNKFYADRLELAFQLQKVLTGSTRPVNLVEFDKLTGKPKGLTAEGLAMLPSPDDSVQQHAQKMQNIRDIIGDTYKAWGVQDAAFGAAWHKAIAEVPPQPMELEENPFGARESSPEEGTEPIDTPSAVTPSPDEEDGTSKDM